MSRIAPRARLTSSLLNPNGWLASSHFCPPYSHGARDLDDHGVENDKSAPPPLPLFCIKSAAAPASAVEYRKSTRPGRDYRFRFSLRLNADRRMKMKVVASFLRQSCQAFLTDALDAHIERVARQPDNGSLLSELQAVAAPRIGA